MAKWRCVEVGKVDLDTVGAAWLLGVTRADQVVILPNAQASEQSLADSSVLCIEVGGSGRVAESNFDHHGESAPYSSAAAQACMSLPVTNLAVAHPSHLERAERLVAVKYDRHRASVVEYIDALDTQGPSVLRGRGGFPTLSDLFVGILLSERDPVEQLHQGVEFLGSVVGSYKDPHGPIEGFDVLAEAKRQHDAKAKAVVETAERGETAQGRRMAVVETDWFGAPGALYGVGVEVVVAFSPHFGPARVPKFTVAGNSVRVDSALPELNALEEGWGGPPTGTIIGSPREGSKLTLLEVAEIVKKAC